MVWTSPYVDVLSVTLGKLPVVNFRTNFDGVKNSLKNTPALALTNSSKQYA